MGSGTPNHTNDPIVSGVWRVACGVWRVAAEG